MTWKHTLEVSRRVYGKWMKTKSFSVLLIFPLENEFLKNCIILETQSEKKLLSVRVCLTALSLTLRTLSDAGQLPTQTKLGQSEQTPKSTQ